MSGYMDFEGVKGYAAYDTAWRKGRDYFAEIESSLSPGEKQQGLRWIVLALPTGRFTPCLILPRGLSYQAWCNSRPNLCVM